MKFLYLIPLFIAGVVSFNPEIHRECKNYCAKEHGEEYRTWSFRYELGDIFKCVCTHGRNLMGHEDYGRCREACTQNHGAEGFKYAFPIYSEVPASWACICTQVKNKTFCIHACSEVQHKAPPMNPIVMKNGQCYYKDHRGVDRYCEVYMKFVDALEAL